MRSGTMAALAAALSALAAPALAKDWPTDPPRLAPNSDITSHRSWVARNIDQEGWQLVDFGLGEFWLISAEQGALNAYPIVRDWLRIERAHPVDLNVTSASALWQVEVDCSKGTLRILRFVNYQHNNLRGSANEGLPNEANGRPVVVKAGSLFGEVTETVCRAAATPNP